MEHAVALVGIVAIFTLLTRAFPFVILGGKREVPPLVKYLGNVLPSAIMTILVIYCLKNVNFLTGTRGIPEIAAEATTKGCSISMVWELWIMCEPERMQR